MYVCTYNMQLKLHFFSDEDMRSKVYSYVFQDQVRSCSTKNRRY
jgi:hypothetical protein